MVSCYVLLIMPQSFLTLLTPSCTMMWFVQKNAPQVVLWCESCNWILKRQSEVNPYTATCSSSVRLEHTIYSNCCITFILETNWQGCYNWDCFFLWITIRNYCSQNQAILTYHFSDSCCNSHKKSVSRITLYNKNIMK